MISSLLHIIGSAIISLGMLFGGQSAPVVYGATSPTGTVPSVFETYLASQQATGDSTMTLASATLRDGTSLSGYECFTLDSNTPTLEYECGTVSGTSVTGLLRGIDATTGTTSVASLIYSHRRGADVKITDYPALSIATNQLAGNQTIPNPLIYASNFTPNFWTNAASNTIATIGIVNSTASVGCANASTVANGCVQIATQIQAASTTVTGSTGANLVLPASMATSSNDVAGLHVVVTQNSGKINWNQIDLATAFTISGGFIDTASSTFTSTTQFTATSSLLAFTSSSVSTSTIAGNLTIAKNASTTNMVISGTCSGCVNPTIVSQSLGNLNGSSPSVASASASCTGIQKVSGCGLNANANSGNGTEPSVYPSSATACTGTVYGGNGSSGASGATVYAICVNP
jgi:hypothetical protein